MYYISDVAVNFVRILIKLDNSKNMYATTIFY